jgi:hypothetical protein
MSPTLLASARLTRRLAQANLARYPRDYYRPADPQVRGFLRQEISA